MDELTRRVHDLPRELFDLIYNLTFSNDTEVQTVGEDYKPPSPLFVDTDSREQFARSYYDGTFYIAHENHGDVAANWLKSLPKSHVDMITRIVVHKLYSYENTCDCFVPERYQETFVNLRLRDWLFRLKKDCLEFPVEKLHISVFGKLWSFDSCRQLKVVADCAFEQDCMAPTCIAAKGVFRTYSRSAATVIERPTRP